MRFPRLAVFSVVGAVVGSLGLSSVSVVPAQTVGSSSSSAGSVSSTVSVSSSSVVSGRRMCRRC